MEHNGVEAPYVVEVDIDGAFSVYDLEDEDQVRPIATRLDREAAEALALAHFTASSPSRS
ncbi:hypothetical protein [Labrys sp. 22185]|uniref:hypothetical protein n=1 Tax=Labrys sp. 22185 TaxID=3453888 RepID=UPI003F83B198